MKVQFTSREKEILALVAKATLRKNIANQLQISIHTVDCHLQSIHKKTNTTTTRMTVIAEIMAVIIVSD